MTNRYAISEHAMRALERLDQRMTLAEQLGEELEALTIAEKRPGLYPEERAAIRRLAHRVERAIREVA